MANIYNLTRLLTCIAILTITTWTLQAQPTCDDPSIIIFDDIEGYTLGDVSDQADHWAPWPGATTGGIVTDEEASSGSQSLKIDAAEDGQDVLLLFEEQTAGHFIIRFDMYVPADKKAYFNLQHEMPAENAGTWGFDAFFNPGGEGILDLFDEQVGFSFPHDAWFTVYVFADLDNDVARLIVNGFTVDYWTFSNGIDGNGDPAPSGSLTAINFFPDDADHLFYLDDVNFWEIPAPEEGEYCYTAVDLASAGTYTVPDLKCFGGGHDLGGGDGAEKGYWFTYTPPQDGVLAISTCGKGVDTRGWIFVGDDCMNLQTIGVNDDQCELAPGEDEWASYREAIVTAGTKYYILWDNAWESAGFEWELILTEEDPIPGDFCQTAIPLQPTIEIPLDGFTGNGAVTGPTIGTTSQGRTPTSYTLTKWYSFRPTADGFMTVSSCDGAFSDTRVWVYTGDCATFETLNLEAVSDDNCGEGAVTSSIDSLPVTAGTNYYIEWDNGWENLGFFWDLIFETEAPTVTFQVDMTLEDIDPLGVFIAGDFSNFENIQMEDEDGDGIYSISLPLNPEGTFQYKFKNGPDGWETIDGDCTTGDNNDRFVEVGTDNMMLDPVCFDYCVSCNAVDIDETALKEGIEIFPNPVAEMLNIRVDLEEADENLNIRILNTMGQAVYESYLGTLQGNNLTIDVSSLPTGIYMVNISNIDVQLTKTIVIE